MSSNKRRALVIHHIEPMWEAYFDKEELLSSVIKHINRAKYDKIILTTLEGTNGYEEIQSFIDETVDWSYGWGKDPKESAECFGLPEENFIEVSTHHETAYLYDWIKELKDYRVSICGGCDGECLTDLEESLEYLKIPYRRIESCIY